LALSKQDEKMRVRRRLQEQAIDLATQNHWEEAVEVNRQLLQLAEDPETYNRLGKAFMELGQYHDSHDAYQQTLRLNSANTIALKNLSRLEALLSHGVESAPIARSQRQQVDLRLFITETGRTAVTTLIDVPRTPAVEALVTGEKVDFRLESNVVYVVDLDGNTLGRLEPKLSQRLAELINGGNRYIAAIAQSDPRQLRVLVRETFQDPSQRGRVSFPGKLGEGSAYVTSTRFDDYGEDVLEEDDTPDEVEALDEEFINNSDDTEIGLEQIEQDMGDDDDNMEE
jgi:tetratricopeptide (TPR) repeat protein